MAKKVSKPKNLKELTKIACRDNTDVTQFLVKQGLPIVPVEGEFETIIGKTVEDIVRGQDNLSTADRRVTVNRLYTIFGYTLSVDRRDHLTDLTRKTHDLIELCAKQGGRNLVNGVEAIHDKIYQGEERHSFPLFITAMRQQIKQMNKLK